MTVAFYGETIEASFGQTPAAEWWRIGWWDALATLALGKPVIAKAFRRDKDSDEAGEAGEEGAGS